MITKSIKNMDLLKITDGTLGNTLYGFDQGWYRTKWQRISGCGPTTVAGLIFYLNQTEAEAKSGISANTKSAGLELMEEVWDFVTPTLMGVNTTKMLYEGTMKYAKAKGLDLSYDALDIPRKKLLRPPFVKVLSFIGNSLEEDNPVAFLNLNNGKEKQLYAWHWVTIVLLEYTEDAKTAVATIMDEGLLKKINLFQWYSTPKIEGGFVRFKRIANAHS